MTGAFGAIGHSRGSHNLTPWLQKLIDLTSITANVRHLTDEIARIVERAGFNHFVYMNVRPVGTNLVSNTPLAWQEQYLRSNWVLRDPVVAIARDRMRTFAWDLKQLRQTAAKEAHSTLQAMQESELRCGFTIPIFTAFGHMAILTATSTQTLNVADWRCDDIIAATAVAQLHARFAASSHVKVSANLIELTPKQARCLRWSAEGKSMHAIAMMEEVSYSTVAFHLANARRALDALSLAQATAIATKLHLI